MTVLQFHVAVAGALHQWGLDLRDFNPGSNAQYTVNTQGNVLAATGGWQHSVAVLANGGVVAWGDNSKNRE